MHMMAGDIEEKTGLKVLHICEATANHMQKMCIKKAVLWERISL